MIPKCCNVYNTTLNQPIILSCYYRHVAWQSARDANGPVAAAAAHVLQPTGRCHLADEALGWHRWLAWIYRNYSVRVKAVAVCTCA